MFCTVRKGKEVICRGDIKAVFCYMFQAEENLAHGLLECFLEKKHAEILLMTEEVLQDDQKVFDSLLNLVSYNYLDFKHVLHNLGYGFSYEKENKPPKASGTRKRPKMDNGNCKS